MKTYCNCASWAECFHWLAPHPCTHLQRWLELSLPLHQGQHRTLAGVAGYAGSLNFWGFHSNWHICCTWHRHIPKPVSWGAPPRKRLQKTSWPFAGGEVWLNVGWFLPCQWTNWQSCSRARLTLRKVGKCHCRQIPGSHLLWSCSRFIRTRFAICISTLSVEALVPWLDLTNTRVVSDNPSLGLWPLTGQRPNRC